MGTKMDFDNIYFITWKGEDMEEKIFEKIERIDELHNEIDELAEEIEMLEEKRDLAEMAKDLKADMDIFKDAGFTDEQAFELTRLLFKRDLAAYDDEWDLDEWDCDCD